MQRVSVVIPTYNHALLIQQTLDSVFAQTRPADEVIVVNDGSPDDTADVLRPLLDRKLIRYIERPNGGQAAARNTGWRAAQGDLIAFLDDDDLWPQDKLARQTQCLETRPDAVLVYGLHTLQLSGGERRPEPLPQAPSGHVYDAFRLRNWMLSLGQALIRRTGIEKVGGFNEAIWGSDDWELLLNLARVGPFVFDPHEALIYRVHENNASRQAVRHARAHLRVALGHLGFNLPLLQAHRREARRYFVPNLMRFAHTAAQQGQHAEALRACLWALPFQFSPRISLQAARHAAACIAHARPW